MDVFHVEGTELAKNFLVLGIPSAILVGLFHEFLHSVLGVSLSAILAISVILGVTVTLGYVVNQKLLDLEIEMYQIVLTALSMIVGHVGLHYVLGFPAVAGVGLGVIVLSAVGYVLNYL